MTIQKENRQEMYNQRLFDKVSAEFDRFIEYAKTLPPEQILELSYEKVSKQDILMSLENQDLDGEQAKALLKLKSPLDEMYQEWLRVDDTYMSELREAMETCGGLAVKEMKKNAKSMER